MSIRRSKTKVLVDGGDPQETVRVKGLIGFVDGQTTNPTLIARNPEVRQLISSGHKFSTKEELDEYKKIVQAISPLVGDAGVSIEVFADFDTTGEQMLAQGRDMFSWIPNAYVKYPCTHEGLRAAQMSVREGIRVNMTLCFSQEQAAAVYAATKGSKDPVYVSPFLGRLDDQGQNGVDLVRNIKRCTKPQMATCTFWRRAFVFSTTCLLRLPCKLNLRRPHLRCGRNGPPHLFHCRKRILCTKG